MQQPDSVFPPIPPERPLPSDCCDGGCDPCVLETYQDELAAYQKALAEWRARQPDSALRSAATGER